VRPIDLGLLGGKHPQLQESLALYRAQAGYARRNCTMLPL
jgi:hypothetical protein